MNADEEALMRKAGRQEGRKSKVESRKSKVGGRRSEVGGRICLIAPAIHYLTFDFFSI